MPLSRLARRRGTKPTLRPLAYAIPVLAAAAILAPAAYAGTDTTFNTALTQFTNFLSGSGGKVITVLSLAGGVVGLASGRFSLGQVAVPVGTGVAAGTGVPIVTAMVTATI
ncbi:hypothetical protein [Novosphingobium sp. Fuku2-ISO-50]|uniref:hypothetical protein n=1 Tax=Novosphingobium sp. Fuku2-ISO-50 TaxID=1739114 RepID=UPI00076DEFC3|nr:hypothetical protein AQZ50_15960 [Novosphingobium sp. Fuku2-ISO-50]